MDLSGDETSTASLHLNSSSSSNREDDRCDYTNTLSDDGYHHQPITTTNPSTYCLYDDEDENYYPRIGGHGYLSDGIGRRKRTTFSQFLTASLNSNEDDDGEGQLLGDNPEAEEEEDSEDIDNEEAAACYSLPGTPLRGQKLIATDGIGNIQVKEYASDNELASCNPIRRRPRRGLCSARPRREREASVTNYWDHPPAGTSRNSKIMQVAMEASADDDEESESGGGGGGGGGLMVITKAKGGKRALCMDLEEVKACKDLGFELEHERVRMMQVPSLSRLSLSSTSIDTTSATATSSGANSPIANWRISSPGDDPREVKARLKVWAQAVALASTTSRHCF